MHFQAAVRMEFHVARAARDRYNFDKSLFSLSGNIIFANFHNARVFAQKMNAKRDLVNFPEQAVRAGQINAMGLIDEILHHVVAQYAAERNPQVMQQAMDWMYEHVGETEVKQALRQFADEFPPLAVYIREVGLDDYLEGESITPSGRSVPNRQIVLEEMLLLWLANANPAFSPFLELFDDSRLEKSSAYPVIIANLHDFFETQPKYGPDNQNLIDMLRAPALASPHSLSDQLEFIRTRWAVLLGRYLYRLLSSLDFIREEEKAIFLGPGPARVLEFGGLEVEPERFSPDREWMPNLVLLAKNAYVWLDQLSKKYKFAISTLSQIPDEELDALARWGVTGLWLIGLWERSQASKRIKQLRGNMDAVASAYSLFSYEIAHDLGGEEAYMDLRDRAWKRGIRLASDMVPNHMGIDSRWVIEQPDWFISLPYSPFPTYSFNGPNLSWDERVGLYLEDHYYDSTDAAVVFKRVDNWTGDTRFIYHGNDGTSMPWNDTAQLNYLNPEVRESVIQVILDVARRFPIIRFDAAMTLAKRHYQRLWFPEPGSGGDIPSRAEYGLTKEQFDAAFPEEFWRMVVDRVAAEVPDTLLLAEAFWMMEGFFVRTLGMHRVYNSAFMNMLRDEKNQEYRLVVKNTIEFDPEILKRYVNFMNNPDERTAVDQFGKGDKYFGVCTMMITMPGLPMLGHGQIEGYAEKYGMEFRRAYWDERPDPYLVERHEREIFPLMRRRYQFAEVQNFLLYDYYTGEGAVNEDVFAYSNRAGDDRSLVLYHNKYSNTSGWIRTSAAYKAGEGDERALQQRTLGQGLDLHDDSNYYVIFRDHVSGLEYIRNSQAVHNQGLFTELRAYQYIVFIDFREIQEDEWGRYGQLEEYLAGRGVPSIDEALKELFLQPIHGPFRQLVNAGSLLWLIDNRWDTEGEPAETQEQALEEVESKVLTLLTEIGGMAGGEEEPGPLATEICADIAAGLALPALGERFPLERSRKYRSAQKFLRQYPDAEGQPALENGAPMVWSTLLGWLVVRKLGKMVAPDSPDYESISRSWIDEWLFGKIIAGAEEEMEVSEAQIRRSVSLIKLLTNYQDWCDDLGKKKDRAYRVLQTWLRDNEMQNFLGVNRYQGVLWYNKEAFDEMLWWMFTAAAIDKTVEAEPEAEETDPAKAIVECFDIIRKLQKADSKSGYQVERLLANAKS